MEVPIQTMNMPFYKNYKLKKFYSLIKSKISSRSDGGNSGMSNSSILTNPFSPYPFKFDFCKLNLNQMIDFIDEAKKSPCYQNEGVIPIVSIGHSKDFFNERDLSRFLSHLSTHHKDSVIPFTFSDLFKSVAWEGLDS